PENRIYVLKPKETLWRLAKRYGTTVEVLMELNNITDYTALEIGQQIVLPVSVDQVVDPRF
ncbi:MAG TPA: LysM peptidoglycan-binding domain-containing protein, partial [Bacillota bacterium]|nr:LysM peptidoglycan-binding domain-containing protein [Bacillota bacterium]